MADSTINELDLIDSVTDSDSIPVYDVSDTSTTPTKKGTFAKILDWISSKTLSSLNTSSALPINSTAVTTVTDKKQNAFSELASKTDFASSDLVIVRSGSTDYKGTLGDLLKTAVSQINATTVNATEFKQNSNDVLDTSNVISVLDTSSSNPVNSSAVNKALAEYGGSRLKKSYTMKTLGFTVGSTVSLFDFLNALINIGLMADYTSSNNEQDCQFLIKNANSDKASIIFKDTTTDQDVTIDMNGFIVKINALYKANESTPSTYKQFFIELRNFKNETNLGLKGYYIGGYTSGTTSWKIKCTEF